MSGTHEIEEINEADHEKEVHWKIHDLPSLAEDDYYNESPIFKYLNTDFCITLLQADYKPDYLNLILRTEDDVDELSLNVLCEFGIKNSRGSKLQLYSFVHTFSRGNDEYHALHAINVRELIQPESQLITKGTLIITCKLYHQGDGIKQIELHSVAKEIRLFYINKDFCDITFSLNGKEFKAHKIVLAAYSKVFAEKLKNTTDGYHVEEIVIDDCDADAFESFLNYLYNCGLQIDSVDKAIQLFKTAQTYEVRGLKLLCIKYIEQNMDVENFFKLIADECDEMIDVTQVFFNKNVSKIFETAEWVGLLKSNTVLANKLLKGMSAKRGSTDSNDDLDVEMLEEERQDELQDELQDEDEEEEEWQEEQRRNQ